MGRKGGFQRLSRAVGVWYNDHIVVNIPAHRAVSAETAEIRCAATVLQLYKKEERTPCVFFIYQISILGSICTTMT